jgi:hypothetical protein
MAYIEGKGKGRGYKGNSMSINANLAYSNGEMPKSKWTKLAILEHLRNEDRDDLAEKATSLPVYVVRKFLENTSIHHTGALFNQTRFYSFNIRRFELADQADFDSIIADHKAKTFKTKEQRESEKQEAIERKAAKAAQLERNKLFKYSKYSTLKRFNAHITPQLEAELIAKREAAIKARREYLREVWTKQDYRPGLDRIEDDDFIDSYVRF